MGQSTPYRGEATPLLRGGHILTEREIARCQRIVTEANNPIRASYVPTNMLRYAQLLLAEAEHKHYQDLLKQYSERERKQLMQKGVLSQKHMQESEPLIGKAICLEHADNS